VAKIRELIDEFSMRMLERLEAPTSARQGFVRLGTFVMDNSATRKEHVGRNYQGVDGYTPIVAHLGNEGSSVDADLGPGARQGAYCAGGLRRAEFSRDAARRPRPEADRHGAVTRVGELRRS
jgi:hypothetical protein